MLYLTSQHKLSDVWCFEVLIIKIIAREMGQTNQVVGEICKLMCHSPWKAPIYTGEQSVHLVLSFCTQGDSSKSEHMLG